MAPEEVAIRHADDSSVTLSWKAPLPCGVNDASHYVVEVKLEGENDFKSLARVSGQSQFYTCDSLPKNKKCQFRVVAENEHGSSGTELRDSISIEQLTQLPQYKGLFEFENVSKIDT